MLEAVTKAAGGMSRVRDHEKLAGLLRETPYAGEVTLSGIQLNAGEVDYRFAPAEGLFYKILGETSGQEVEGEEHLLKLMGELVTAKREYDRVAEALKSVRETGYGLVPPIQSEMTLEEPELVKQGSRFGVRLKASAPSLHMIRVDIQTEVSPIVGTEKQSEELIKYLLSEFENDPTNMFGKSLNDLVREELGNKLMHMPEDARMKIQEALQKIINEGSGGVICILL